MGIIVLGRTAGRVFLGAFGRLVQFVVEMGPFETIYIDETVAACNGGGGPLGHPRVYLNLGPAGKVECPYCSRLFVNRAISGVETGEATTPPRTSEERNA